MKVLHIADLHLDRSFEGLKLLPKAIADKLQGANQKALTAIVDSAIKNEVDVVILAGDTFHQSRTSIRTQAFFIDEMKRLEQKNIPVIMTFGNHDYYVADKYWFDFPKNMFLFKKEQVETHYFMTKNQERVAISGFSYEHSWINTSKLPEFPVRDSTVDIHIGIYHGDTINNDQQSYAPFSISDMKNTGYDYWALGHVHQPQIVSANPLIVYPGTPQGHTKKEQAVQGAAIVSIQSGHATTRFEQITQVIWEVATYSLSKAKNLQEALIILLDALLNQRDQRDCLMLKEIRLTHTSHLDEEFQRSYQSGELLQYLQEKLLLETRDSLWLFQIEILSDECNQKTMISADPKLLEVLERTYLQADIFSNTLQELVKNPQFSAVIPINDEWRKRCIEQADQKIKKQIVIQEDQ